MKAKELIKILQGVNPEAHVLFKVREKNSDEVIERQFCLGELQDVTAGYCADGAGYPSHYLTPEQLEAWRIRWSVPVDRGGWEEAFCITTFRQDLD